MKDLFDSFIGWISNREHSVSKKVIYVISLIIILLIINDLTGFSYYNINQKKISQIESIERIKKLSTDEKLLTELARIEKEILERKTIYEDAINFLKVNLNGKQIYYNQQHEVSYWMHIATSSYILLFFWLILLIVPFFSTTIREAIGISIFATILAIISIYINALIFSLIPIFDSRISYLLNIILHPLSIWGLVAFFNRKKRKGKKVKVLNESE